MRAVYLYGPPGVGKLTVAQELASLTGFKLVHNHLSVNLVTAVFPFQSGAWLRLLRRVREDVFAAASAEGVDIIITSVYNGSPATAEAWQTMLQPISTSGGTVLWVRLTCELPELLRRVQMESRNAYEKLTDPQVLIDRFARELLFPTVPFRPHMDVENTSRSPSEVARVIASHFELPRSDS